MNDKNTKKWTPPDWNVPLSPLERFARNITHESHQGMQAFDSGTEERVRMIGSCVISRDSLREMLEMIYDAAYQNGHKDAASIDPQPRADLDTFLDGVLKDR